ncbi:DUF421 domain-containing protein [Lewinella sp. JB7]|uniref:DUF421 domain-containing protein n=1 Tax=Lewinella sp. JB7 TaxID=2962887 RepID=UPI0020C9D4EF|nr:YetF domain-containing protein [Lewinella sp. JB7]MCP9237449.1 DUF421 domain-containing protein [Lewinella sp. JB7]
MEDWLNASWPLLLETVASVFFIFTAIVILVRISGLRTFAKMSSFDFASTIAIGSILASVVMSSETSLVKGVVALGTIMLFQQIFAGLKIRWDTFQQISENSPTLLMDGTTFLQDNMKKTGVSRSDIIAKLREANVIRLAQVKAVVLETTGDISVLHQEEGGGELEDLLLEGVMR